MAGGSTAPPKMAMHMRPESSAARCGRASTVMENRSGQMLAKPRPQTTTPATATAGMPLMRPRMPRMPRPALTDEEPLGRERPQDDASHQTADGQCPEDEGRAEHPCLVLLETEGLESWREPGGEAHLGAHVEEDAEDGEAEDRLSQKGEAPRDARGLRRSSSRGRAADRSATRLTRVRTRNTGKIARHPIVPT